MMEDQRATEMLISGTDQYGRQVTESITMPVPTTEPMVVRRITMLLVSPDPLTRRRGWRAIARAQGKSRMVVRLMAEQQRRWDRYSKHGR